MRGRGRQLESAPSHTWAAESGHGARAQESLQFEWNTRTPPGTQGPVPRSRPNDRPHSAARVLSRQQRHFPWHWSVPQNLLGTTVCQAEGRCCRPREQAEPDPCPPGSVRLVLPTRELGKGEGTLERSPLLVRVVLTKPQIPSGHQPSQLLFPRPREGVWFGPGVPPPVHPPPKAAPIPSLQERKFPAAGHRLLGGCEATGEAVASV